MVGQKAPFLQIQTSVSDELILTSFAGSDSLSRLFCYNLTARSSQLITAEKILKQPVSITIRKNDQGTLPPYYFHGIVSRFKVSKTDQGVHGYSLEVRPSLWLLNFDAHTRIFKDQSVVAIVKKICEKAQIKLDTASLTSQYPKKTYCVQYRETTLNFIQRLLEEAGIFYYFKQEKDQHTLVLLDQFSKCPSCPQKVLKYSNEASHPGEHISVWSEQYQLYSGNYKHTDYNFMTPSDSLDSEKSQKPVLASVDQLTIFDYPGGYQDAQEGKQLADIRFAAMEANYQTMQAQSNCTDLYAGNKFSLQQGTESPSDYVITSITVLARDESQLGSSATKTPQMFSNSFTAVSAKTNYRPQRLAVKPVIMGYQSATVIGDGQNEEIYVNPQGEIEVQFPWDKESGSCWLRVVQNWAGKGWGTIFNPRIGHEVIVQYENGDPDRPIVVGSAYNGNNPPPYSLPDEQFISGIKTCSSKSDAKVAYNELRFEDKQGSERIYMHAQKDHVREIGNSETVTIMKGNQNINVKAGKSTLKAAQAIKLSVGANAIEINTQGVYINGQLIKVNKPG